MWLYVVEITLKSDNSTGQESLCYAEILEITLASRYFLYNPGRREEERYFELKASCSALSVNCDRMNDIITGNCNRALRV